MRTILSAALGLGLTLAISGPVMGKSLDWIKCERFKDVFSPSEQVAGCTAIIQSGEQTDLATAFNNRGNGYRELEEFEKAIADFDQAIKLEPTYVAAWHNRGLTYIAHDNDHAIADFTQAIKLKPLYAEALTGRGMAFQQKGDLQKAFDDFTAALAIAPNAVAYENRGDVYWERGDLEHSLKDYDEAVKLAPNSQHLNGRCWVRITLGGSPMEALSDCNKALALDPENIGAYDSRGLVYLKLGRFKDALTDYNTALKRGPKLASFLFGRGIAKLRLGDKAGGNADIATAKALEAGIEATYAKYGIKP